MDTARVKRGDSLWRISRTTYGQGRRYTVIFTANDDQIRNPNLIYPGQVLVLPADKADAAPGAGR
nr:LysM peptidoglycan-binding domain-containing protein [Hansschlegelia zhihuaiae]